MTPKEEFDKKRKRIHTKYYKIAALEAGYCCECRKNELAPNSKRLCTYCLLRANSRQRIRRIEKRKKDVEQKRDEQLALKYGTMGERVFIPPSRQERINSIFCKRGVENACRSRSDKTNL